MENTTTSIILAVHDEATALERNLPAFIEAAAAAGGRVIVVDDMSTDDTPDLLMRMRTEYGDTLYTTFLPRSVIINPSRLRLALTVGAKAAKGCRVVLADIHRPPVSQAWLDGLLEGEAALVYTSRKGDVSHVVATSLSDLKATVTKAERQSGRGHRGRWLKMRRGLYDAVSVEWEKVFDAINLFDRNVRGSRLWRLRLRVWLQM